MDQWEYKFSSIVKDTESNLSKIKSRLCNGYESTSNGQSHSQSKHASSSSFPGLTLTYPAKKAWPNVHYQDYRDHGNDPQVDEYRPLDQSQGVIMLLQDRLDSQDKAIEQLTQRCRRLEDDKDVYHRKVSELRAELNKVLGRLSERGVDLHTERKLEQWRHDVAAEMSALQTQLHTYKLEKSHNTDDSSSRSLALSHETHQIRKFMQEECETFRRELDTVRNKLAQMELSVTAVDAETKEVCRRQKRTDQKVCEVADSQHSTSKDLTRAKADLQDEKSQALQLRGSFQSLTAKLVHMENEMCVDSNYHSRSSASSKRIPRPLRQKSRNQSVPTRPTHDDISASDSDDWGAPQSSEFSLGLPLTSCSIKEPVTDDDYLLTDLNLSDDVSSCGDGLDLDDLQ